MTTFPRPKQSESLAMPGDDGFRFDNDESRPPPGPEAKEPSPEQSVPGSKSWAIGGTLQDDDLVIGLIVRSSWLLRLWE